MIPWIPVVTNVVPKTTPIDHSHGDHNGYQGEDYDWPSLVAMVKGMGGGKGDGKCYNYGEQGRIAANCPQT